MNPLAVFGDGTTTSIIDTSALESTLTTAQFGAIISSLLPIVAVAVLVGFLCYIVRWSVSLFRGV